MLNHQLEKQKKEFEELLSRQMIDHQKEVENENIKHLKILQEEQTFNYKREENLKNQMDFIKTSFHSYKVNYFIKFIFLLKYFLLIIDES